MTKTKPQELPPTVRKTLANWISKWVVDDGNNKLLWNDKAPTPNQVIDLLHQAELKADKRVEEAIQKMRIDIKQVVGTNAVYLLPSQTERCEGFYKKGLYKVVGIDVTKDLAESLNHKDTK